MGLKIKFRVKVFKLLLSDQNKKVFKILYIILCVCVFGGVGFRSRGSLESLGLVVEPPLRSHSNSTTFSSLKAFNFLAPNYSQGVCNISSYTQILGTYSEKFRRSSPSFKSLPFISKSEILVLTNTHTHTHIYTHTHTN